MDEDQDTSQKPKGWFATTHWSVVLNAKDDSSSRAGEALESLCGAYWYPLYAYVRSRGCSHEDAQDLTQEFFSRLLDKNYLAAVEQEKGRFRSFLLVAINRFLAKEWRKAGAQKRGGRLQRFSIDDPNVQSRYQSSLQTRVSPDTVFERQWALTVLDRARCRLAEEYNQTGRGELFLILGKYLSGDRPGVSYANAAEGMGMSEGAVKKAVQRLRQRYGDQIRTEIAQTLSRPTEIEAELRHLMSVFGK